MPGVMQLVLNGAQDQYLTGSPTFSYFKTAVRTHTNFSMESVRQTFATKPTLEHNSSSYTCQLQRVGDLLSNIYFAFELPPIYSSDQFRFRWITGIAKHMILNYSISIGTQLIDQRYGDWMDIWTELSMTNDQADSYNNMTGNVPEFTNPVSNNSKVIIKNNKIYYNYYPASTGPNNPSILGRKFTVPLDFWFTKSSALALPLVALQSQIPSITIELRGIEDLYQVYDTATDTYVSPSQLRTLYNLRELATPAVTIKDFTQNALVVDLNAYLECNFIYLDDVERRTVASSTADFIVERIYRTEQSGIGRQNTVELVLSNPVKELLWVLRRTDTSRYNNWADYTDNGAEILNTAKLIWNGIDRFEEKQADFFNKLQPYQYHTRAPRQGIYTYSFGIYPEKVQPSGTFNASLINKIQLAVTTNTNTSLEYQIIVYSVYYNVFRVMGGNGWMVFTI